MLSRRQLRFLFVTLFLAGGVVVGFGLVETAGSSTVSGRIAGGPEAEDAQVAPPSSGITVIATDSSKWNSGPNAKPRATSELVALRANGTVAYHNGSHDWYWDVDPVEDAEATVEYAFADKLAGVECTTNLSHEEHGVSEATWERYDRDTDECTRNGFERVNLRTGEVTRIWSTVTPGKAESRYHDIDRIGPDRLVVADIYFDRVFVVNTTTEKIEPTWNASDTFSKQSGGPFPADWTHLNDVEVLDDGRIMVSLRNHDQVAFIENGTIVENRTLGTDGDHATLYEQHNPDYIPAKRGGPAVVVADSENNRVVEYQREDGNWVQTWTWQDARMQWPRDADRLPNGHTLITDSNGNRVFEVDEQGTVVWSADVAFPYEAERLGTGDESTGGSSARAAGLDTRTNSITERAWIGIKDVLPAKLLNGLMYLTPVWMGLAEVIGLAVILVVGTAWVVLELRWAIDDGRILVGWPPTDQEP